MAYILLWDSLGGCINIVIYQWGCAQLMNMLNIILKIKFIKSHFNSKQHWAFGVYVPIAKAHTHTLIYIYKYSLYNVTHILQRWWVCNGYSIIQMLYEQYNILKYHYNKVYYNVSVIEPYLEWSKHN